MSEPKWFRGAGKRGVELVKMARQEFGLLSRAEFRMFFHAATGQLVNCFIPETVQTTCRSPLPQNNNGPIRSKCFIWLCITPEAQNLISHKGIMIQNAIFYDIIDLQFAKTKLNIIFDYCIFINQILLYDASFNSLILKNSSFNKIKADGINIKSNLNIINCTINNGAYFIGSLISGDMNCTGTKFNNTNGDALCANKITICGSLNMKKINCDQGEICISDAKINGAVELDESMIKNNGITLNANGAVIKSHIFMRDNFKSIGRISLINTKLYGNLECQNSFFLNNNSTCIYGDNLEVGGTARFSKSNARGEIRLLGAQIKKDMICNNLKVTNKNQFSLSMDGIKVGGSLYLRELVSIGQLRLPGSTVNGQLDCTGARFISRNDIALNAQNMSIDGPILIADGFLSIGRVYLAGIISNSLLYISDIKIARKFNLSLHSSRIKNIHFHKNSWPQRGSIVLNGLKYDYFDSIDGTHKKELLELIRFQPSVRPKVNSDGKFYPQPYEQLSSSLARAGHIEEAKDVLVAKANDYLSYSKIPIRRMLFYKFMKFTIGYGYRPLRALWWIVAFIILGSVIFYVGQLNGDMVHSKQFVQSTTKDQCEENPYAFYQFVHYPSFQAFVYSVDNFIPLVDLHLEEYWKPDASQGEPLIVGETEIHITGNFLRWYRWFHIMAGWIFTTLFVVGLTGLVRGDPSRE